MSDRQPFETTEKRRLRLAARDRLEGAGFEVADEPKQLALPSNSNLSGHLVGDIQATDPDQTLHVFSVITNGKKPVPGWLRNWSFAALELENVKFYAITPSPSKQFRDSCESCGAGLIDIGDGSQFVHILEPSREAVERIKEATENAIRGLRRELETKREDLRTVLQVRRDQIGATTTGLSGDQVSFYFSEINIEAEKLDSWSEEVSVSIDEFSSRPDSATERRILKSIKAGPPK